MARDEFKKNYGDFSDPVFYQENRIVYPREDVSTAIGHGSGFLKPFGLNVCYDFDCMYNLIKHILSLSLAIFELFKIILCLRINI